MKRYWFKRIFHQSIGGGKRAILAPATWEGWTVIGIYVAVIIADFYFFPPFRSDSTFFFIAIISSLISFVILWLKCDKNKPS